MTNPNHGEPIVTSPVDPAPINEVSVGAAPTSAASDNVDMFAVARIAQEVDAAAFGGPASIKLIAPAKVNLYLEIGDKRPDGYHDAVSIMHALMLHDVLRMKLAVAQAPGLTINLACTEREGIDPLDVEAQDNIVAKAIRRLAENVGRAADETVVVHLEKHIPAQAGLGGGSSDAAAALVGAARLWGIEPTDPRVEEVARSLGADVAFFLHGGCVCLTGVGDEFAHKLEPMKSSLVLIKPEGGVSTSAAYRAFDENPSLIASADRTTALAAVRAQDVPLRNNLVSASEQLLPVLADIRTWTSSHPDVQESLMSGSGSAVFALCPSFDAAARVAVQAQAQGWWARTTMFGNARAAIVPNR